MWIAAGGGGRGSRAQKQDGAGERARGKTPEAADESTAHQGGDNLCFDSREDDESGKRIDVCGVRGALGWRRRVGWDCRVD